MFIPFGRLVIVFSALAWTLASRAQDQVDTLSSLSANLPVIEINAYSAKSDLVRIPAAVQLIRDTLHLFPQLSFAQAINQAPGVKLEERSPGSYRLSIRGSTLRSPFGIRNVKVYLDGFNLSDGGGNTYLNLFEPGLVSKSEILKGPASSLYGAGTGGVLLLSTDPTQNQLSLSYGTYDQFTESISLYKNFARWKVSVFQSHQQSEGYREQSAMRRDLLYASQRYKSGRHNLIFVQAYGDLKYETPGGLTFDQQKSNPRQARPKTATLPGAVEQEASIFNKTLWTGAAYDYQINRSWSLNPNFTAWYTDFRNPFITNYEIRFEKNFSARPVLKYFTTTPGGSFEWTNGLEYLFQGGRVKNYVNNKGEKGNLTGAADIDGIQNNWFSQINWNLKRWQWLAGMSLNQQVYRYKTPGLEDDQRKESGPVFMPRASVSYSLGREDAVFISAARGYSPPSLAEIRPSSGEYNQELLPEQGWNFELGIKGYRNRLQYSFNLYSLNLRDAIVRRNDAAGVEYFINAGGANIRGLEAWLQYNFSWLELYGSTAYQPYEFVDYKQRTDDFSGNRVTGVPRAVHTFRLSLNPFAAMLLGGGWYYQSDMPLQDANTSFHPAYSLVNLFANYRLPISGQNISLSVAVDNLFNTAYSPGPDINAAFNRFYNPGLLRTVVVGLKWKM
ncbi:MAG TPA: TonB-dependent receptor [Saprospiraceae bacterium]|nr:TonB-dependent receptor [Saprospiraceae bacterium]HNT22326.1 TonB-dependent receptor [Saprospiraceae bacterium]